MEYLHEHEREHLKGLKVLELGCGAGLPGIFAFKFGAKGITFQSLKFEILSELLNVVSVWFNDYNEDVLNEITIPNTIVNYDSQAAETRFFSGDWGSLESIYLTKLLKEESDKFDLILTSETIYNQENQSKLVSIFRQFLKQEGKVLVAGKTFYFGVGGGMRQFEKVVKDSGLKSEIVKSYDTGVKREILKIQL